ncbi:MAG: aminotransferase [Gammaproteobacteria bacterium]|nr:aminotransferase [Gammaproteobacteria bacterium]MDH4255759.1 aminotransferase [Gammaproteobacteria bacterium]MDH5308684.1 aminotransferase [Gammaproteobacteria bacterium]
MSAPAKGGARQTIETDLWSQDRRHHLHPYQNFVTYNEHGSLIISGGEGAWLRDSDGKKYFDAVGGMWCTNIGLGRQEMADAIAEQVTRLAYANPFTDMSNEPAARLAAKLAELAPGDLNHVFFTCGGSTANDSAYRLIQMYQSARGQKQKTHVLCRRDAYHGTTYLTASLSGKAGDRMPDFRYITEGIHHLTSPNFYRAPDGMDAAAFCDYLVDEMEQKILELGPENVAAFWAEPILGSGGVIVPPEDYNRRTWELCRKYDILYVADEVVTGFGRLGHWFVSKDMFGVEPDIICCAKGLTSGYLPLGAMIVSDRIYDALGDDADRWFTAGFTYSAHPVCCAAALKNIEILERENLFENVRNVGTYFEQQLRTLLDLPIVGDIRGRLFMMCVVNVMNKKTREFFPPEVMIGKRISNHAEALGLIVRPVVDLNVLSPSLTMTKDDVDYIVSKLRQAILLTIDDLREEGYLRSA